MPKKQGSDNPLPLLLVLFAALLIFLIAAGVLLIPLVILIIAIKSAVAYRSEKSATCARTGCTVRPADVTSNDLWLTHEEKSQFADIYNKMEQAVRTLNSAEEEANRKGLTRNADGRISRRSKLGKQLRSTIEAAQQRVEDLKAPLKHWQALPQSRYKRLVSGYRAAIALGVGFIGFSIATYVGLAAKFEDAAAGVYSLTSLPKNLASNFLAGLFSPSDETSKYIDISAAVSVLAISFAVMVTAVFLAWIAARIMTRNAERPPLVDHNTLNQFNVGYRNKVKDKATQVSSEEMRQRSSLATNDRPTSARMDTADPTVDGRIDSSEAAHPGTLKQAVETASTHHTFQGEPLVGQHEIEDAVPEDHVAPDKLNSAPISWSRLAIWSCLCGLLSIFFIPTVPAIILGHWALRKDLGKKRGLPFARVGLSLGWFFLVLLVLALIFGEA